MIKKFRTYLQNIKLRERLMLFFIITAGLPVILTGIFTLTYFNNINRKNAETSLQDKLHNAQLLYERKKYDLEKIVRLASTDNLVLINLELMLTQPISIHLGNIIKSNNLSFLTILDTEGKIIISGNSNYFNKPEGPVLKDDLLSQSLNDGFVSFTSKISSGDFKSIEKISSKSEEVTVVASVIPLKTYDNRVLGFVFGGNVVGEITNENSFHFIEEIKKSTMAEVLFFDSNGIISYSEGDSKKFKIRFSDTLFSDIRKSSGNIMDTVKINGDSYLFCFAPIKLFELGPGIVMGIGVLENKYLAVQKQAALVLLIMTLISLFLAVIMAFFLSESISRPIFSIVDGTKKITKGNFSERIVVSSQDEIGILAESFNRMTEQLSRRIKMDELISSLSRKFINIPRSETDKSIREALKEISSLVEADRSYVFLFSENMTTITNTHEWHRSHLRPNRHMRQNISVDEYPWFTKMIQKHDEVYIPDVSLLPDSASVEREKWLDENIKTIICVPLFYGKFLEGFIGFDFLQKLDASYGEDVKLLRIIGEIICNTLERNKADEKLSNSKDALRNVFNAQSTMLISVDSEGDVTQWNTSVEKYTGIAEETAVSTKVWDLIPFLKLYRDNIIGAIKKHKPQKLLREMVNDPIKNVKMFYDISFIPLTSSRDSGILVKIDDITETVRKDDQLIQAQKMETVRTLAGGLAHDFNNVIGAITATVSYLQYSLDEGMIDDVEVKANILNISKSAFRAGEMVKQLLTMSRKHELNFSPVDMKQVIYNVIKIGEHLFDKSVRIKTEINAESSLVYADYSQIEQVLLNLCINACHAMTIMREENEEQGGNLIIALRNFFVERKIHPDAVEGNYILIKVTDTGVGMDKNTIAKIFDPFFTTKDKSKGTGLGLAMVYNIIKQHNGFIDVYSEMGVGSTFNIFLPELISSEKTVEISEDSVVELFKGKGKILVIDDEIEMREICKKILHQCGYTVMLAANGSEGLKVFINRQDEINLVLLDIAMPRLSGDKVFAEIKKISPSAKVLLTSGFKQDRRVKHALSSGADGFIQKPYTMLELSKKVYEILNR